MALNKIQDEMLALSGNACKAWANFNGSGTIAIRDSFNVSSLTDNGVGDYSVNLTNVLSSTNCAVLGTMGGNVSPRQVFTAYPNTTSVIRVVVHYTGIGNQDVGYIAVAVFEN